jgi:hypothetical protein
MPQRGDNPNEVLFETGTKFAYYVDNYYDMDSAICRPVDEMLSALEEEFECPIVYLQLRRERDATPHQTTHDTYQASEKLLFKCVNCAKPIPLFDELTSSTNHESETPAWLRAIKAIVAKQKKRTSRKARATPNSRRHSLSRASRPRASATRSTTRK